MTEKTSPYRARRAEREKLAQQAEDLAKKAPAPKLKKKPSKPGKKP